jgi:hypothetical protein
MVTRTVVALAVLVIAFAALVGPDPAAEPRTSAVDPATPCSRSAAGGRRSLGSVFSRRKALKGEEIPMQRGGPITVPLPASRHVDAHMLVAIATTLDDPRASG